MQNQDIIEALKEAIDHIGEKGDLATVMEEVYQKTGTLNNVAYAVLIYPLIVFLEKLEVKSNPPRDFKGLVSEDEKREIQLPPLKPQSLT